jgi:hypothetical protein
MTLRNAHLSDARLKDAVALLPAAMSEWHPEWHLGVNALTDTKAPRARKSLDGGG